MLKTTYLNYSRTVTNHKKNPDSHFCTGLLFILLLLITFFYTWKGKPATAKQPKVLPTGKGGSKADHPMQHTRGAET